MHLCCSHKHKQVFSCSGSFLFHNLPWIRVSIDKCRRKQEIKVLGEIGTKVTSRVVLAVYSTEEKYAETKCPNLDSFIQHEHMKLNPCQRRFYYSRPSPMKLGSKNGLLDTPSILFVKNIFSASNFFMHIFNMGTNF